MDRWMIYLAAHCYLSFTSQWMCFSVWCSRFSNITRHWKHWHKPDYLICGSHVVLWWVYAPNSGNRIIFIPIDFSSASFYFWKMKQMKDLFCSVVKSSNLPLCPPSRFTGGQRNFNLMPPYTVFCSRTQGTGTHVRGRYCMPAFFGLILYSDAKSKKVRFKKQKYSTFQRWEV